MATIQLMRKNGTKHDTVVVDDDAPIFTNPRDLYVYQYSNMQLSGTGAKKFLQPTIGYDHEIYGRSPMAVIMQSVEFKDARRLPGTAPNDFRTCCFDATTVERHRNKQWQRLSAEFDKLNPAC